MENPKSKGTSLSLTLEENLKKAVTEMLILHLLSERECYIGELITAISEKSRGVLSIVFPYSAIYRLQQSGYLTESCKRIAPDGRRRQYYVITNAGKAYLRQLLETYDRFSKGIESILTDGGACHE